MDATQAPLPSEKAPPLAQGHAKLEMAWEDLVEARDDPQVTTGKREIALAITNLQQAVMWLGRARLIQSGQLGQDQPRIDDPDWDASRN